MSALEVNGLRVSFPTGKGRVTAVAGVDLAIRPGTTMGLVGESGSGKSTVARAIMGLAKVEAGSVSVEGRPVGGDRRSLALLRRHVQLVFQNPYGSLNPRRTIGATLAEAASMLDRDQRQSPLELLDLVSLPRHIVDRFPHQLSGGQRQRVAIARALALRPSVLLADEITASLDVSVQASILNLLARLQQSLGLAYLFISHDLAVVRHLSDEVAVMYLGRIVEKGPAQQVFSAPAHPYTRALLDAVPTRGRRRREAIRLEGEIPDPRNPPVGCPFHTRCPVGPRYEAGRESCVASLPGLEPGPSADSEVACHFPLVGATTTRSQEGESQGVG